MKNKRIITPIVIAFAVCLIVIFWGAWLKSTDGMIGVLKWEKEINNVFNSILYSGWLPILFAVLYAFFELKEKKIAKLFLTLLGFVSTILTVSAIGSFIFFSYNGSKNLDNLAPLNIIGVNAELPNRENYATDEDVLLHLAFTSDPHWGSSNANSSECSKVLKQLGSRNYDGVFILGDIVDLGLYDDPIRTATEEISEALKNTPVGFVMGNHDALINSSRKFSKIFRGGAKEPYYQIDCGPVHLIVLNLLWDATDFTEKQKKWLINSLSAIPETDTVIVMTHCFAVSSGYYTKSGKLFADIPDVIGRVTPFFEKYNVDFVISGHAHLMEYLERHDISYAIVGTMGGALDSKIDYYSPWSKWICNDSFGWLEVDIYKKFFNFTFYDSDGNVLASAWRETVIDKTEEK